jgi:hypothetical protein
MTCRELLDQARLPDAGLTPHENRPDDRHAPQQVRHNTITVHAVFTKQQDRRRRPNTAHGS